MKEVLLFLAEGFEECEALIVVDLFRRADIDIRTVSVTGDKEVVSAHNVRITADESIEDIWEDVWQGIVEPEMIILPGGMPGTEYLDRSRYLKRIIERQASRNGKIAAICAAPSILGRRGLLAGRRATCYPGFENFLSDAEYTADPVTVDGNYITANGLGAAVDFALTLIGELRDKEVADGVAQAILHR
ncbi:MAG: DJ-1/PfpI family protein [Eubacteriales bacterium]|nr:DJ-1/PfpI family protein [Eubacteriales bacterium]